MIDNINIDFQILKTGDPKILVISDVSSWGIIKDKPSIIEITPPTQDTPITHVFEKGKNNIFNSSNLLLSPIGASNDLSDGLYKVVLKGSPSTNYKEKFFIKTDKTRIELYNLYTSLHPYNTEQNKELKNQIFEAKLFIEAAEAAVALNNNTQGLVFLKRAVEYLKDLNNSK